MKTEVVIELPEACKLMGEHVRSRPGNRNNIIASVEIFQVESGQPFRFHVVMFDTEKAATEYLAAQETVTFAPSLNG